MDDPWWVDGETWRPVGGYECLYEVSDCGRVRRLPAVVTPVYASGVAQRRKVRGRMLKLTVSRMERGDLRHTVSLCKDGLVKRKLVHCLVAEAFIGPKPSGMEVAHGDGNSLNNHLRNLRYATPLENNADKLIHGTQPRGGEVWNAKLTDGEVRFIRKMRGQVTGAELARMFFVSSSTIKDIQLRKRWRHVE